VVCRNDDGAIVGYFGLGQIFDGMFRNAYLGNYAFEPFAGRGYMREEGLARRYLKIGPLARSRAVGTHRRG
jgi:RimJ/RimL family protein N-acetyltransferase